MDSFIRIRNIQSILNAQQIMNDALSVYHNDQRLWTVQELRDALHHVQFVNTLPKKCITVKFMADDEFKCMGINPGLLPLKERSTSETGWYIPFISDE